MEFLTEAAGMVSGVTGVVVGAAAMCRRWYGG